MAIAPPSKIGPYILMGHMGRGGMGQVCKAMSPSGETLAIKIIHPYLIESEETLSRFQREAHLLLRLNHPNIVRAYSYSDQQPCYLAMQYIEGESLDNRLKKGGLSEAEATAIVGDIASALDYAHAQGAIHRDVKPGNILLDRSTGRALLTDFGLSKLRQQESVQLTMQDAVIGTPGYMSPEQAAAESVDYHTDIYSLGVVAYELLTGRAPFKGDTPVAQIMNRLYDSPIPPRQAKASLPPAVERVLLRALARQPEDRYQSAGEFVSELRQAWQSPAESGEIGYSLPAQPAEDGSYLLDSRDLLAVGPDGMLDLNGVIVPASRWREAANVFYQLGGQMRLTVIPPDGANRGQIVLTREGDGLNLQMVFSGEGSQPAAVLKLG